MVFPFAKPWDTFWLAEIDYLFIIRILKSKYQFETLNKDFHA